jgi:hypothetical protein
VPTNELRMELNSRCVENMAAKSGRKIIRCYAKQSKSLKASELKYVRSLPDSKTGKMAMKLDLLIGMPITTLFNHPNHALNIANGTLGHLVDIQWGRNTEFVEIPSNENFVVASRYPEILFVKIMDCEKILVKGLGPGVVPILPDPNAVSMKIDLKNRRKVKIKANGFKVAMAFALTVDKSQGLSLDSGTIWSLFSAARTLVRTASFYVAISRVRRLEDIHLLEPLLLETLVRRFSPKQDALDEDAKLVAMSTITE